jgi:hypothetical protein
VLARLTTTAASAAATAATTSTSAARRETGGVGEYADLRANLTNRRGVEAGFLQRVEHLRRARVEQDAVTTLRRRELGRGTWTRLLEVPVDVVHAGATHTVDRRE